MNIENPVIQTPLPKVQVGGGAEKAGGGADPEAVVNLVSMGFTEKQAARALRKCDNNLERAMDWIFSHMDEPESDEEMKTEAVVPSKFENPSPNSGKYNLQSFVTHLGAGVHSGHYVCHVRKEGDQWIYFNDSKVALTTEPPIEKGYMYFFTKV